MPHLQIRKLRLSDVTQLESGGAGAELVSCFLQSLAHCSKHPWGGALVPQQQAEGLARTVSSWSFCLTFCGGSSGTAQAL